MDSSRQAGSGVQTVQILTSSFSTNINLNQVLATLSVSNLTCTIGLIIVSASKRIKGDNMHSAFAKSKHVIPVGVKKLCIPGFLYDCLVMNPGVTGWSKG